MPNKLSEATADAVKLLLGECFPLRLCRVERGRSVEGHREACKGVGVRVQRVGQTRLMVYAPATLFLLSDISLELGQRFGNEVSGIIPTSSAAPCNSPASSIFMRQCGASSLALRPMKCLRFLACDGMFWRPGMRPLRRKTHP